MKAVKWFLIVLTSLLGLFIAVSFFLPKDYHVERSIEIDAPKEFVYAQVADLEAWQKWNPWSTVDEDMLVIYGETRTGVGASYSWQSEVAGNGRMTIIEAQAPDDVRFLLEFEGYEELPSYSSIRLDSGEAGLPTLVTWTFEGNVGDKLFARWMVLLMDTFVGASYETGLARLKELSETKGAIPEAVSASQPG